jgi:short-chain dehydrogenase/reductase SDR
MEKKYIVITGASSGIGRASAITFAKKNKDVVLVARREEKLIELKNEINKINPNVEVLIYVTDLSKRNEVFELFEKLKNLPIETLINNAGIGSIKTTIEEDTDYLIKLFDTNVSALMLLSTLFLKYFGNNKGTQLINVSSGAGYSIYKKCVSYSASKFYVSTFTEGLSREMKENNLPLKVKLLVPEATESEFLQKALKINEKVDYGKKFEKYHTSEKLSEFLYELYESDYPVGRVDDKNYKFYLEDYHHPYIEW